MSDASVTSSRRREPDFVIGTGLRVAAILLSFAVALAVWFDVPPSWRIAPVLVFMTSVPGAAVMGFNRSGDRLAIAAMSVAFSLAICSALATIAVWSRLYRPETMLIVTALSSAVLLAIAPLSRRGSGDDVTVGTSAG